MSEDADWIVPFVDSGIYAKQVWRPDSPLKGNEIEISRGEGFTQARRDGVTEQTLYSNDYY